MIMNYDKPLVAIHCLVYNHEPYLRDCFDGFVMQQTNFPFVAIVHDDASTDGSVAIIREYEEKYPNIFKPIYETKNQFSKQDGSLENIMDKAIISTGAKYVAMCEGDDYWIDPLKLQKQVDFMEANTDCALCFHKVSTLINQTGEMMGEFIVRDMPGKSTIIDLAEGNYIHTPSVMYRLYPSILEQYEKMMPCLPGDYVMWVLLAEKGYLYKLNDAMAVYQYGSGIWSMAQSVKYDVSYLCTLNKLYIAIENKQVKGLLQKQIQDIVDAIIYIEEDFRKIRKSKAYCLGKILLNPLKIIKTLLRK